MILVPVALVLLASKFNQAILIGNPIAATQNGSAALSNATHSDSFVGGDSQGETIGNKQHQDSDSTNATFFYEANAFLTNNDNKNPLKNNQNQRNKESPSLPTGDGRGAESSGHLQLPPAAGLSMTSARNGRMMDLDALMGDFAASQANKARSQSGSRQSRYLSQVSPPSIDVGGGKKLHIQGFIPIVGVKDVTEEDNAAAGGNEASGSLEQASRLQRQQQLQSQLQRQQQQQQAQANELPYAQSSIGHASFGVQRYLSTGDQLQQPQHTATSNPAAQQVDAKFSGASVIESIRKPIKRLTDYAISEPLQQAASTNLQSQQQQNCLCVPFYMCKNGYISESSLGKSQVQQVILQQQMSSKPAQVDQHIEMKSGQSITAPTALQQQQQPQYADSYVSVDERSFDRDMITTTPDLAVEQLYANQTSPSADYSIESEQSNKQASVGTQTALSVANSTAEAATSDYSEDILGRMLGLKSSTSRISSGLSQSAASSATGVCGLLRSCCNIPVHLFPSQQGMANERLVAQYVSQLPATTSSSNKHQQQLQMQQQYALTVLRDQQQQAATGDFIGQTLTSHQRLPYAFPAQSSSLSMMRMQPLNTFNQNALDAASLAHRSTQFQTSPTARYQQQQQLAQYTRDSPQLQHLQSFQQQAKAISAVPLGSSSMLANVGAIGIGQHQQHQQVTPLQSAGSSMKNQVMLAVNQAGTRKILEGRCGLRQSAGIHGRVQNLQYHESSADFGEYPAQAAILKRLGGSDSLFVCGGTLISQYWVATAAHCIKKHAQSDLKVRLGEWDVHRDDEFYPHVEKEVRDLVVHPEFVAGNLVNDIALLRLDSPIDPSLPHVNPACLPAIDESFTSQHCWVTGWGKDSFGQKGSFQAVLREVELPVVGRAECESALRQTRLGPHYRLHSGFICAGGEGGRDACEGDGGSGLYCIQADGVIKVAGLVSWGIGCGQAGVPGVYVNLAHYRSWIENIISIDEDIYSPFSNMISSSLISERSNANSSSLSSSSSSGQTSNNGDTSGADAVALATPATTETLPPPPEQQQAATTPQPS